MATTAGGIWYPDEGTNFNINTILATMASSIESKVVPYARSVGPVNMSYAGGSNFETYSAGANPKATKLGKIVFFEGIVRCNTANYISSSTARTVGTLPSGYRPVVTQVIVCQGSGTTTWSLTIATNGVVSASRVSGSQAANYWMPINVSFRAP